jgi:ribonuclease HI
MKAVLYADGASLGNPGDSGIGAVIKTETRTREVSEHIGVATNNVAEYSALIRGLEEAHGLGATELEVNLDSELLVKQIRGEYRVRNRNLKPLFIKAMALLGSFRSYSIKHVPREMNKRADRLAKQGARPPGKSPSTPGRRPGSGEQQSSAKRSTKPGKKGNVLPSGQSNLPF